MQSKYNIIALGKITFKIVSLKYVKGKLREL